MSETTERTLAVEQRDLAAIGIDILHAARNELYVNLPYMDAALCALSIEPGDATLFVATDGARIVYAGSYVADMFMRSRTIVNRTYLHMVLHCMLRHLYKKHAHDPLLWDLACDVAVESILDSLNYPCLGNGSAAAMRPKVYGRLRREMPVLTAEGIYRYLVQSALAPDERVRWQRTFFADDHVLWAGEDENEQSERQDEKWRELSERTQSGMESFLATSATGGESIYEQVKAANRDAVDYRAFLRRFAVLHEVCAVDGDAFDYVFYTYGLRLYGNMPLVEPPETKEDRRIEDFVIAVDTSMSTSGELVRKFLSCTYSILCSTETFARRVNIRILQCDDKLRSDVAIHDMRELQDYMEHFQLTGGSATDFRPVFEHVQTLLDEGVFTQLRGLLYFTDGMGIYPKKRPPYDVAFVMLENPAIEMETPPWAIRLMLARDELETAYDNTKREEPIT
ncbi:MAG: VWA-like domain-containing protein [Clostridia bacterium]|nr:VWA-like domain-containing protein [Clostridia bacterium]